MKNLLAKKSAKLVLDIIFICVLLLALSATTFTDDRITRNLPKFTDVPESHWAYLHITRLVFEEAITGYTDGTFKPSNNITRAEFLAVVVRAVSTIPDPPPASQHWATNIVKSAEKNNLLETGEFAADTWNNPINRQEMAKVMARAMQFVRKETLMEKTSVYTTRVTDFNSIPISYQPYVAQVYAKGIVTGYTDGSFGGAKLATRAEAATMVVRLIDPVYRITMEANTGVTTGSAIAFDPKTDVAADGRMKLAKAEEYLMKTLKSIRFYEEGGKFYFEGNAAEVPEGFENLVSISVRVSPSVGIGFGYSTYPSRAQTALPKAGPFKVELEGISSRNQIGGAMVIIYIDTPNHTNTTYDKHGYEVIWTIDTDNDNRIDVSDYITYQKRTSKFYDFSTIFQW
jgi:hypothetical protein